MKLVFLVNKKYTFLHALNAGQHNEPFKNWANFTFKKWQKHPQECYFLAGFAEWPLLKKTSLKTLASETEKLLNKWLKTPESRRLIRETEQYRKWVQKEWNRGGKRALKELENIIKTPLPKKKISVYITHPKLKNGLAVTPEIITWGHEEEWPNYSIVYLCHEILHTIFWGKTSDFIHAVIELATDQELRIRLNGGGKYFEFPTHKHLLKLEKKLLPYWKSYLKNPSQNLKQFMEKVMKKADV